MRDFLMLVNYKNHDPVIQSQISNMTIWSIEISFKTQIAQLKLYKMWSITDEICLFISDTAKNMFDLDHLVRNEFVQVSFFVIYQVYNLWLMAPLIAINSLRFIFSAIHFRQFKKGSHCFLFCWHWLGNINCP